MGFLERLQQIERNQALKDGVEVEYLQKYKFPPLPTKTKGFPAKAMTAEKQTDRNAKGQTVNLMNLASVPLDFEPLVGDEIKVYGDKWTVASFCGHNPYDFVLEAQRIPTGERRFGFAG